MPAFATSLRTNDLARSDFSLLRSASDLIEAKPLREAVTEATFKVLDGVDWRAAAVAGAAGKRPDPNGHDQMVATTDPTKLFVDGGVGEEEIDANDVFQGGMGDCYLMAAMANLAKLDPGAIRNMIKENKDKDGNVVSYTVDLYAKDARGNLVKSPQTVDAKEFSKNASGFGDTDVAGNREIWPRIIEKAYAQLKGGHSAIGYGGGANDAIEALTGQRASINSPGSYSFAQLEADIKAKKPICFLTPDTKDADGNVVNGKKEKLLGGHGMYQDHYYYATETRIKDGQQQVRLMNPWGSSHPGADKDGWVPFDDLMKSGMVERVDTGAPVGPLARMLREITGRMLFPF